MVRFVWLTTTSNFLLTATEAIFNLDDFSFTHSWKFRKTCDSNSCEIFTSGSEVWGTRRWVGHWTKSASRKRLQIFGWIELVEYKIHSTTTSWCCIRSMSNVKMRPLIFSLYEKQSIMTDDMNNSRWQWASRLDTSIAFNFHRRISSLQLSTLCVIEHNESIDTEAMSRLQIGYNKNIQQIFRAAWNIPRNPIYFEFSTTIRPFWQSISILRSVDALFVVQVEGNLQAGRNPKFRGIATDDVFRAPRQRFATKEWITVQFDTIGSRPSNRLLAVSIGFTN